MLWQDKQSQLHVLRLNLEFDKTLYKMPMYKPTTGVRLYVYSRLTLVVEFWEASHISPNIATLGSNLDSESKLSSDESQSGI